MLSKALVDGKSTPISFKFVGNNLLISLPHFRHQLLYDPDLSVLLNPESPYSQSDCGGDGVPIAAIVVPVVVVPSLFVIAAVLVLVGGLLYYARHKTQSGGSVNFAPDT